MRTRAPLEQKPILEILVSHETVDWAARSPPFDAKCEKPQKNWKLFCFGKNFLWIKYERLNSLGLGWNRQLSIAINFIPNCPRTMYFVCAHYGSTFSVYAIFCTGDGGVVKLWYPAGFLQVATKQKRFNNSVLSGILQYRLGSATRITCDQWNNTV
jgi:hypothetical protein